MMKVYIRKHIIDDIEYREHVLWYFFPDPIYKFLLYWWLPSKPIPIKCIIGEKEMVTIAREIFEKALKDYVRDIYNETGARRFGRRGYVRLLGEIEKPYTVPKDYTIFDVYPGPETDRLEINIKDHVERMVKNPTQYFSRPEEITKYLEHCEWRKKHETIYHGVPRPWHVNVTKELTKEVHLVYQQHINEATLTAKTMRYFRELDLELYLKDAKKIHAPEIEFSDAWTLRMYHLDFSKISFEINCFKKLISIIYNNIFCPIFNFMCRSFESFTQIVQTRKEFSILLDILKHPKTVQFIDILKHSKIIQLIENLKSLCVSGINLFFENIILIGSVSIFATILASIIGFSIILFIDEKYKIHIEPVIPPEPPKTQKS